MAPSTKRTDTLPEAQSAAELVEWLVASDDGEQAEETAPAQNLPSPSVEHLPPAYRDVLRATRWWLLYGTAGFAVLCIVIGAAEALFGR